MTTAEMLRAARDRAGLTQRELAVAADVPQASVSRIERGLISPRGTTIERWLAACGMTLESRSIQPSGIDLTLIRRRLALSPLERSRLGAREANAMLRLLGRSRLRHARP